MKPVDPDRSLPRSRHARPLLAACLVLSLSGCVGTGPEGGSRPTGSVAFALVGDTPYDATEEKQFSHMMREIDAADLAFVVHVGDFWSDGAIWKEGATGLPPCSDETFDDRLHRVQSSRHPFVLVPGDNDWTDCYRAKPRAYDPQERLGKLRHAFFPDGRSLGRGTMLLTRQSEDPRFANYRENARWTLGGVTFVTLHMVGSNNNLGRTPEADAEHAQRNAANLAWLREAFKHARRNDSLGVMIFAHANPKFESNWPARYQRRYLLGGLGLKPPQARQETGYDEFLALLESETEAFGKPVVYAHGDTHTFRVDKPLIGSFSQRIVENFTRVETFGSQDVHWVRVVIDPDDPNVFRIRQQVVKEDRSAQ